MELLLFAGHRTAPRNLTTFGGPSLSMICEAQEPERLVFVVGLGHVEATNDNSRDHKNDDITKQQI